jgi:ribosomal protein S18 acetylase RimI-like enzyme
MASYGGHAPAAEDAGGWRTVMASVSGALNGVGAKYVIAESADGGRVGVAGAELIMLSGAFAPKKTLHISVVYVLPQFRRCGIGGRLVTTILDWGSGAGAELCDLHVLCDNPAKSLYEKIGFSAREVQMVRRLSESSDRAS